MTGGLRKADAEAQRLGVPKKRIYRWRTEEGMPSVQIGRSVYFVEADVDAWIRSLTSTEKGNPTCPETTNGAPKTPPDESLNQSKAA